MQDRIGRYKLLERIGAGSQGTVYRAEDPDLDRIVAIKVFDHLTTMSNQDIQPIRREARLAAALPHPNIATIYEFQIDDDVAYMVMEYVPDSLDRHIKSETEIDLKETLKILIQACSALSSAHDAGIVHRDIKPPNILLTDSRSVKVVDFGVARLMESSTTATTVGTFAYMSPEQWKGEPVDQRTDIYSLGVIAYEMLVGNRPFDGNLAELFQKHTGHSVPKMPDALGIPPSLEMVVVKALSKDPDDRFQSASEMANALSSAIAGAPLSEPASLERRGSWHRFFGKKAIVIGTLIAVFFVLLLAITFFYDNGSSDGASQVSQSIPPSVKLPSLVERTSENVETILASSPFIPIIPSCGELFPWDTSFVGAPVTYEEDQIKSTKMICSSPYFGKEAFISIEEFGSKEQALDDLVKPYSEIDGKLVDEVNFALEDSVWGSVIPFRAFRRLPGSQEPNEILVELEANIENYNVTLVGLRKGDVVPNKITPSFEYMRSSIDSILLNFNSVTAADTEGCSQLDDVIFFGGMDSTTYEIDSFTYFLLLQNHCEITGGVFASPPYSVSGVIEGQIKGDEISFVSKAEKNSANVEINYVGTLSHENDTAEPSGSYSVLQDGEIGLWNGTPYMKLRSMLEDFYWGPIEVFGVVRAENNFKEANEILVEIFITETERLEKEFREYDVDPIETWPFCKDTFFARSDIAELSMSLSAADAQYSINALEESIERMEQNLDLASQFDPEEISAEESKSLCAEFSELTSVAPIPTPFSAISQESDDKNLSISPEAKAPRIPEPDPTPTSSVAISHYYSGIELFDAGRFEEALIEFTKALEIDPEYADAYDRKGRIYYSMKNWDQAIAEYSEALSIDPLVSDVYLRRGIAYFKLFKFELALADNNMAILLDPQNFTAYLERGYVHSATGAYTEAVEDYTIVIEGEPESWKLSDVYASRGGAYRHLGEYEKALRDANSAIKLDSESSSGYMERSSVLLKMGKPIDALEDIDIAIMLNPENSWAYFEKGQTLMALLNDEEAIENFTKAIELDPNIQTYYRGRATAYVVAGEYEKVIEDITYSLNELRVSPEETANLHSTRGFAHYLLGQHEFALADISVAIGISPDNAYFYYARGNTYRDLGKLLEAESDYSKAIEIDPTDPLIFYDRGQIRMTLKKFAEAESDFIEAERLGYK